MTLPLKPEARKRVDKSGFKPDITEKGEYRYLTELKKKGIELGSVRYRQAVEHAMTHLYEYRPYYSHFFADAVRKETFKVETMAVGIHNARICLMYNPDFLALLSPAGGARAFQHEAGHVFGGHLSHDKHVPKEVAQTTAYIWAKELAVNTLIRDIVNYVGFTVVPGDLSIDVQEHKAWDYYYDLLKEEMLTLPMPRFEAQGEWDNHSGGVLDEHGNWVKGDQEDVQKEVIKQAVAYAFAKAENDSKHPLRGYMPGELVDRLKELLKTNSVPFERLFRNFVGSHIKTGRRPTMIRLSKRRHVPPGNTFVRKLRAIWYQDDSYSMQMEEKALCRSECHNAVQNAGVSIFFQRFCYGLVGPMVDLSEANFDQVLGYAEGGTDFETVIDHAYEHRPDIIFIATDGEAPTPSRKPPCPVAWILTHDGDAHPWGTIIRMPSIPDIRKGYRAVIERWG